MFKIFSDIVFICLESSAFVKSQVSTAKLFAGDGIDGGDLANLNIRVAGGVYHNCIVWNEKVTVKKVNSEMGTDSMFGEDISEADQNGRMDLIKQFGMVLVEIENFVVLLRRKDC